MMVFDVSAAIVLYKNDKVELLKTINSFLACKRPSKLFLIDNSPTDELKDIIADRRIEYIHNPANLGYGSGHNIAIKAMLYQSKYHLVLNPDVSFEPDTLETIFLYMEANTDVGQVMPKVYYEDGSIQRLCKLLPSPFDLFGRRFLRNFAWARKRNEKYELADFDYNSILNTPCLSGCFMFLRTSVLREVGQFDERFFMYLEDYDLTRRIHRVSKTIYFPNATIVHGYRNESYKSLRLLKVHLRSAVKYFNKWGWFRDTERSALNRGVLGRIAARGGESASLYGKFEG